MPKEKTAEEIVHKAMLPMNLIKENNKLLKRNIDLQEENKDLLDTKNLLQNNLDKLLKENIDLREEVKQLKADENEYQERLVFETKKAEKLEKENKKLKEMIKGFDKIVEQMNDIQEPWIQRKDLPCLLEQYDKWLQTEYENAILENNVIAFSKKTQIKKAREFLKNKKAEND